MTEPTTEPTEATTETVEPETDWKAEAEKWQALSKKNEQRAKENSTAAKELEKLRSESMTEQERAVEQAREQAIRETQTTFAGRLVDAEVRVAAAGRGLDIDALLEGLDRTRFITDDGEADRDAIATWVDRIAPPPEPRTSPDLGTRRTVPANTPLNSDPLEQALRSKLGIQ